MATVDNKQNRVPYYGANKGDIAMSQRDYYDMLDPLVDERLSQRMQTKFKNLWEQNSWNMFQIPIVALPFAMLTTRLFTGPVYRGLGNKRTWWIAFTFFMPAWCYYMAHVPVPKKLYTDILTDNTLDGEYVRRTLSVRKPGLWRKISHELFNKGYQFPEMNEYNEALEFPRNFVSAHV